MDVHVGQAASRCLGAWIEFSFQPGQHFPSTCRGLGTVLTAPGEVLAQKRKQIPDSELVAVVAA